MESYLYVIITACLLQLWVIYNIITLSSRITEAIDTLTTITVDLVREDVLTGARYKAIQQFIDKLDKLQ